MSERYQIVERIAAGGMAEVYRGESAGVEGFRKRVAIKRVLPQLSANRDFIDMFLDEARLCAYLSHSRCVQVFDIGQAGGSHFIVMEYVDGADLQGVLEFLSARDRRMPVELACSIALGMCEGLSYAHQACDHQGNPLHIVHRDISPHNVLLTKFGEVKLVDFGLAKASSHLVEEDQDIVRGKFGYLAPEVTLGQPSDHRVDLFAAGIVLWEMLAGRRLFRGDSDVETFKLVRATHVPDIREVRAEVPEALGAVLTRALARDPAARYKSADDFAKELGLVLMHADRPVTYIDLGRLVRETSAERKKKIHQAGKDTYGIVGDLILDAIHDFSAATKDPVVSATASTARTTRTTDTGAAKKKSGDDFVDPAAWGLDALFDEPAPKAAAAQPGPLPASQASPVSAAPSSTGRSAPATKPSATPPGVLSTAAAERARTPVVAKKDGPFWRKWFGA